MFHEMLQLQNPIDSKALECHHGPILELFRFEAMNGSRDDQRLGIRGYGDDGKFEQFLFLEISASTTIIPCVFHGLEANRGGVQEPALQELEDRLRKRMHLGGRKCGAREELSVFDMDLRGFGDGEAVIIVRPQDDGIFLVL